MKIFCISLLKALLENVFVIWSLKFITLVSNIFFSKPEMNAENNCLFLCFILFNFFAAISIDGDLS